MRVDAARHQAALRDDLLEMSRRYGGDTREIHGRCLSRDQAALRDHLLEELLVQQVLALAHDVLEHVHLEGWG